MTKKNVKKNKKMRVEGMLIIALSFVLLAIPIVNVYTKALLSESNYELERVRGKIKEQEGINSSLKMEISELASLDKIQVVASENGLTYQNNNIKVVTNEDNPRSKSYEKKE